MKIVVARCQRPFLQLAFLAAILPISATAPPRAPKTLPPLQSYAEPGAVALMRDVIAAYREVKGLRFIVQNTWQTGNKAPTTNQVQVAFSRPEQMRVSLAPPNFSAKGERYDFLFDGMSFYDITHSEKIMPDPENPGKNKIVSSVHYSKTEGGTAKEDFLESAFFSSGVLPTIFSLLQGKDNITASSNRPGIYLRQRVTRLPSRILYGQKVDGLQVRSSVSLGHSNFQPATTAVFWFGVNDHLLRRCQSSQPAQMSGGGVGIETGERIAPQLQPSRRGSSSIVAIEVNPAFTAADFRFVPPPGAIQTDEYGQPLPKP